MPSAGSITSKIGYIPSLNGIRALAILIVIWGHAQLPTPILGSTGVTIFFFLSGYLITSLLRTEADNRRSVSIKDFYLRRALRILPPLYIVLGLAIVATLTGLLVARMTAWGVFSTAAFWSNYFIIFDGRDGLPAGMNALWSLAVEEHYYLLFTLLYVAMRRWLPRRTHQVAVLIALCLIIAAWRIYLESHGASWDRLYLATDTRADAILWGAIMAIGWDPMHGDVRPPRRPWVLTPILLVCAGVFFAISWLPQVFSMTIGYTVQSILLFGVFLPLILAPQSIIGRLMNWAPVAFVGTLSYTLYLIHRPALMVAEKYLPVPHLASATIAIAFSFVFAYAMYRFVEQPAARLRRKLSHQATPASASVSLSMERSRAGSK
ncbi:acyltransferase family protein [Plantibacter sp. Mn2098]|uniref:acyltransferase family protein n=1 Tax=Plantibacter sp. Mn2098 TaxID=3395266 RepID=UPI003BC5828E